MGHVLEDMLHIHVSKGQTNWEDYLLVLELACNSLKYVFTRFSPFILKVPITNSCGFSYETNPFMSIVRITNSSRTTYGMNPPN